MPAMHIGVNHECPYLRADSLSIGDQLFFCVNRQFTLFQPFQRMYINQRLALVFTLSVAPQTPCAKGFAAENRRCLFARHLRRRCAFSTSNRRAERGAADGVFRQTCDIDAVREPVHIRNAKGNKDRLVLLPHNTLLLLRRFWLTHRNPIFLFPNRHAGLKGAASAKPKKQFLCRPESHSGRPGLVQQPAQIAAAHDLTLFVRQ